MEADRKEADIDDKRRFILIIIVNRGWLVAGLRPELVPVPLRKSEPGELVDYYCCSDVSTIYLNLIYLLLCCSVLSLFSIRFELRNFLYACKNHLITHSSFVSNFSIFYCSKSVCYCFFSSPIAKLEPDYRSCRERESLVVCFAGFRWPAC